MLSLIHIFSLAVRVRSVFVRLSVNDIVNANDVSYIIFGKYMMTDITSTSFTFYDEGEDAKVDLEVQIYGKLRDTDAKFTVAVAPEMNSGPTTVASSIYKMKTRTPSRFFPYKLKKSQTYLLQYSPSI